MSAVRISRSALLVTALMMLPAFVIGEWLASLVGLAVFSLHNVLEGFNGVITFALVLAVTRGES